MSGSRVMRAIRVSEFGAPSVLQVCSGVGIPQPGHRQVIDKLHTRWVVTWDGLNFFFFYIFFWEVEVTEVMQAVV